MHESIGCLSLCGQPLLANSRATGCAIPRRDTRTARVWEVGKQVWEAGEQVRRWVEHVYTPLWQGVLAMELITLGHTETLSAGVLAGVYAAYAYPGHCPAQFIWLYRCPTPPGPPLTPEVACQQGFQALGPSLTLPSPAASGHAVLASNRVTPRAGTVYVHHWPAPGFPACRS
jgi:hypothetical protein